ncbi:hypothetical protein GXM_08335 [Nostoc sphaeroides CCNUC1]|uniref:Uncharacterized protein n=1 Tax=Nostoc sphaeroides CCNUC1 TaxID=2653204 RepID=A0A5P8WE39_9NOSO|nr:hypothetical protein GXM_08335 [Nostoc sphaeroides CCNUC1]
MPQTSAFVLLKLKEEALGRGLFLQGEKGKGQYNKELFPTT